MLVGCSSAPTAADDGAPDTGEVEDVGAGGPGPVAGTLEEVVVADLSAAGSGLVPDDSAEDRAVPVDDAAVDAAVEAAVRWLDGHLTDVQTGGSGDPAVGALVGDAAAASTGMADPDHPVVAATYHATVGARGGPEWLRMSTVVERDDGELTATFVFVPEGPDEVTLVAVQLGDGAPVPTSDASDGEGSA
jgi:hypothetical protein